MVGSAPGRPADVESMNGAVTASAASDAPSYVAPLPRVTEPWLARLWVPAATVVIHGDGWATVEAYGPLLPADAATKTPARAAKRNAISAGSAKFVWEPLIE